MIYPHMLDIPPWNINIDMDIYIYIIWLYWSCWLQSRMIPPFFLQWLKHHVRNHLLDISPIKSSQWFQHMEWMTCSIKSHPPAYGYPGQGGETGAAGTRTPRARTGDLGPGTIVDHEFGESLGDVVMSWEFREEDPPTRPVNIQKTMEDPPFYSWVNQLTIYFYGHFQ